MSLVRISVPSVQAVDADAHGSEDGNRPVPMMVRYHHAFRHRGTNLWGEMTVVNPGAHVDLDLNLGCRISIETSTVSIAWPEPEKASGHPMQAEEAVMQKAESDAPTASEARPSCGFCIAWSGPYFLADPSVSSPFFRLTEDPSKVQRFWTVRCAVGAMSALGDLVDALITNAPRLGLPRIVECDEQFLTRR